MSALDTAIQEYVDLLILQYRQKPRARATIAILVKQALADLFMSQIAGGFDLETAVGPQLDILGKYAGVNRYSNSGGAINFFGYANYAGGGSSNGFNDYQGAALNGYIYQDYTGQSLPRTAFSDTQYRFVIKLQIALNNFDGTLAYIQQFLADFFPGAISVVDNLNMSLTYYVQPGVVIPIPSSALQNFLPCPMGCGISVNILTAGNTRITSDGSIRVTTDASTRITSVY